MRYGSRNEFTFDLTWEQRQLCAWVAEQAGSGVRRIHYADAKAVLGIAGDRDITHLLRQIRERVDAIHEMVQFPIVNTTSPYFDIHMNADCIWDDYCQAERESVGLDFESQSYEMGIGHRSGYGCEVCAV